MLLFRQSYLDLSHINFFLGSFSGFFGGRGGFRLVFVNFKSDITLSCFFYQFLFHVLRPLGLRGLERHPPQDKRFRREREFRLPRRRLFQTVSIGDTVSYRCYEVIEQIFVNQEGTMGFRLR